ncbi:substrate-binding periplasmic protein [Chitinimonas sp. JJ19]|uniref:substrate-binding periplasmic protein n=1 Tax=Chitinimonas sp. JJ19 TaxID=3109352 RepID=UPI001A4C45A7|nr:transporter substrate-binding domain-containing protein [Chitinimonas sp.]
MRARLLAAVRYLLGLLLCLVPPVLAQAEVLTVVGEHAPPYRIMQDKACRGLYCDTMQAIARRAGFELRYVQVPMARALMMMEHGQADLMLGPNRTPERERYMVFLEAAFPPARKVFYQRADKPLLRAYADLAGKVVSVERGKRFFEPFDSDTALVKDWVSDPRIALRKVAMGRSDAALMPEQLGDWLLREDVMELVKAPWAVEGRPSHIAFSIASPRIKWRPAIEQAFAEMTREGELKAIYAQYR